MYMYRAETQYMFLWTKIIVKKLAVCILVASLNSTPVIVSIVVGYVSIVCFVSVN